MVNENDFIVIQYTGKFDNGDIFDTSEGRAPLEFKVGAGMVIPGLEKEVLGMKLDEEKSITIEPDEAYGQYDDTMTHAFPKTEAGSFEPEIGMSLSVQLTDGSYRPALVKDITDDEIILDLNHPPAGTTLHFDIKLLEINDHPKYTTDCSGCSGCSDGSCGC